LTDGWTHLIARPGTVSFVFQKFNLLPTSDGPNRNIDLARYFGGKKEDETDAEFP